MTDKRLSHVMEHARTIGLKPKTIFDIGYNTGTPGLYNIFKDVEYIIVEPLEESKVFMEYAIKELEKASYYIAAAGPFSGETNVYISPLDGRSSIIQHVGPERIVPMVTLDQIAEEKGTQGPYIIKIDTQGYEIEILKGATIVLKETEYIVLEISLFPFSGVPVFDEVIAYMKSKGFTAYDFFNFNYRPIDGALGQIDIVFVHDNGLFKQRKSFRTKEQREKNVQKKLEGRAKALEQIKLGTKFI